MKDEVPSESRNYHGKEVLAYGYARNRRDRTCKNESLFLLQHLQSNRPHMHSEDDSLTELVVVILPSHRWSIDRFWMCRPTLLPSLNERRAHPETPREGVGSDLISENDGER